MPSFIVQAYHDISYKLDNWARKYPNNFFLATFALIQVIN